MSDTFQYFQFAFREVGPASGEIFRFIQSTDIEDEHPAKIFVNQIREKLKYIEGISGGYLIKKNRPVSVKQGSVQIDQTELQIGRQISGYLKEASSMALFVCSAGSVFTDMINEQSQQGNIMEAYLLDAIGSLTVEKAMDHVQQVLSDEMRQRGMHISNRYSPGYCNWELQEQKKLFSLIGRNPVGVTLTDSSLMIPAKSVSGIIGIGRNLRKRAYGCKICNNSTCTYRKIIDEQNEEYK